MTRIINTFSSVSARPLNNTFSTALRSVSELEVISYRIETDDGYTAWGECVETPAITGDSSAKIKGALEIEIPKTILDKEFEGAQEFWNNHIQPLDVVGSAKAAIDIALYDLESQLSGKSMKELLGCASEFIRTDVTIPITPISEIESLVSVRLKDGFDSFKVKLGAEAVKLSIEKLALIRSLIGDESGLRVDANQAWSIEHSLEFLNECGHLNIEYLEQPLVASDKARLAQISRGTDIEIMADEACFTMADLDELISLGDIDLVNLKVLKSGGVTPLLAMAQKAKNSGLKVSIGSMMEGDLGVRIASIIAGAIAPDLIHDLDAAWWARESAIKYSDGRVWVS